MTRIVGQDRPLAALARSIAGGSLPHAWIFHGPAGVGKFTTALEFARLVLDPSVREQDLQAFAAPRGTRTDELITAGSHPDLTVIRKERSKDSQIASLREKKQTNIPVDLLRELMLGGIVDDTTFDAPVWRTPYFGRAKVFIVDEAELLDLVGQNALLKTLEEPPPRTYIVLVTTREERLLPTIRSRCQRLAFGPLDEASMRRWMESAQLGVERDALAWLTRFAEGSPGMATIALKYGVHDWARDLAAPMANLARGKYVAGLGDRMSALIEGCSEAIVKENSKASKEAANRLGARLLFGVLARIVRDGIEGATKADDIELDRVAVSAARAERWAALADVITDADEGIRRHLNQKQVLGNLAAQWTARGAGRDGAVTGREIERVWVLRRMPEIPTGAERWHIEQGYLPEREEPGQFPEGRVRRVLTSDGRTRHFHTVKRGAGLVRDETEREIEEREFARLWPTTEGRRIAKTRHRATVGKLTWEIDEFTSLPLVMAEVELPDERADAPLPPWLAPHVAKEVTDDARYRNAALAIDGLPRWFGSNSSAMS